MKILLTTAATSKHTIKLMTVPLNVASISNLHSTLHTKTLQSDTATTLTL